MVFKVHLPGYPGFASADMEIAPTSGKFSRRPQPEVRKERRKAGRILRKSRDVPSRISKQQPPQNLNQKKGLPHQARQPRREIDPEKPIPPKSILKKTRPDYNVVVDTNDEHISSPSLPPPTKLSRGVRDRLADDDAEIAALEKALGVKDAKKLPKSFGDDGLDVLLEGLVTDTAQSTSAKRKTSEEEDWLKTKRLKASRPAPTVTQVNEVRERGDGRQVPISDDSLEGSNAESEETSDAESSFEGLPADPSPRKPEQRIRENPYVAPPAVSGTGHQSRYIPPSKRGSGEGSTGALSKLRRQLQGLLNRLTESNLLSLLKDVESLYREYSRQDVNVTLVDLLMGLLCDPASLQDTFIILHAGFITALHKVLGSEIGAHVISRIHDDFSTLYCSSSQEEAGGKRLLNLIALFAQLYNFKVIGSSLIYDLVRLLIEELSEKNAELLLRIVRSMCCFVLTCPDYYMLTIDKGSGTQLRKDDAASLKAINQLLQSAVAETGPENISVRANFMVETIDSLANKGMKTGKVESLINDEHTVRMNRILGSLNERGIRASEPLNISLKGLRDSDRRGKWWVIGANYRDEEQLLHNDRVTHDLSPSTQKSPPLRATSTDEIDLPQLARQLGLNTDIRRSIFITIMSGADFETACDQLRKLHLKSSQKFEIPRVLIRCSGAQEQYNPYYTLVARRLISHEPKLKRAFQYSLWNLFDKLRNEGDDEEEDGHAFQTGSLELRSLINHAKMFGTLIAEDGIPISVLKDLNFAFLPDKLQQIAEVLLITVILGSQDWIETGRNEKRLMEIFLQAKDAPTMAQGLRYFLKKVVSNTDIAGSGEKEATVKWGCRVARDALKAISTSSNTA